MAAKARGVKFGKQPPKPETIETKVRIVRQLLSEGKTAKQAAETANWSRAASYRYLKQYGADSAESGQLEHGRGRSRYAERKSWLHGNERLPRLTELSMP